MVEIQREGYPMKRFWKLGNVAGIAVETHATLLLLVGWRSMEHWGLSPDRRSKAVAFLLPQRGEITLIRANRT